MHTLKKRLKEIDEHYEIYENDGMFSIGYKGRFRTERIISFDKDGIYFDETISPAPLRSSYPFYKSDVLPDLWKIIKLVSEYLN